jgi:hypothetical protein
MPLDQLILEIFKMSDMSLITQLTIPQHKSLLTSELAILKQLKNK